MKNKFALPVLVLALIGSSCANRGIGPQGGPVDSIPPVLLKAKPENGTLGFKGKEIELQFDEYLQLNNPAENVLISPPQQHPADIRAVGKKIKISFQEDLMDSTTYTIDFGNAIQDNNERNPLSDFSYSFTTDGPIDSLEIYGQLINAEDLNPLSGITVGIYSDMDDSAFSTKPFLRIGRTNEEGEFSIKNIHAGTYRLFALGDNSKDYVYQPGEGLAFYDETITPYIDIRIEKDSIYRTDTLAADSSMVLDSVITSEYYYFEPSNILLRYFKEDKQRHYFQRALRKEAHCFSLLFAAPQDQMPTIVPLRKESDILQQDSTWVNFLEHSICCPSAHLDTINYWLTDSAAIRMDTIRFAMTYLKSDSLYNLIAQTDTVLAIYRAPRASAKAQALQQKNKKKAALELSSNASDKFHVYDTLCIRSAAPIQTFISDSIHLKQRQDTTWKDIDFNIEFSDESKMRLLLIFPITPSANYKLSVDSAAITDIYQHSNTKSEFSMRVHALEDYATLMVKLADFTPQAVIQLLNESDKPVRQMKAQQEGCQFTNIDGGIYYLRLFMDLNGDGKWTTGDWNKKRQPEPVYYFPKKLNLRSNWDFEQTIDWKNIPLLDQKPNAIRKDGNKKGK